MLSPTQLTGGQFQDSQGNVLELGYLTMKLSQDEETNDSLICSGIEIRIQLDSNGNVASSASTPAAPNQYCWANDVLLPVNSYYMVTGYTANGQLAFGPNCQQVIGSTPFDTGQWVPDHVISWIPPVQVPTVEVNGTTLTVQSPVNFIDSETVTFSNPSGGEIQATANVVVPSVNCLPQPDSSIFAYWSAVSGGGSGWTVIFDNLSVGYSGDSHADATATSASTFILTNGCGAIGNAYIWPTRDIVYKSTCLLTATGTTAFRFWGITNASVGTSGPPNPMTADCIGIEVFETGSGVSNFFLVTSIGGTPSSVDSGVPCVSGTRYELGFTVHAGIVTLQINGVSVTTSATNLPTSNALSLAYCQQRTGGFVDFSTALEYNYCSNATP